jgi:hypothetical protein
MTPHTPSLRSSGSQKVGARAAGPHSVQQPFPGEEEAGEVGRQHQAR